ncbi:hypothetical protein HK104_001001 [Borealophlyctis nickersoniae]|nr:hypothetical protein HK104_001001 [Borealophlyctis nickersoniae]
MSTPQPRQARQPRQVPLTPATRPPGPFPNQPQPPPSFIKALREAITYLLRLSRSLADPYVKAASRGVKSPATQRAALSVGIYAGIFAAAIGLAVGAYMLFYAAYIPKVSHVVPVYMQYGNPGETVFPTAHVEFATPQTITAEPNQGTFLTPEQLYNVALELYVPDSKHNFELGMSNEPNIILKCFLNIHPNLGNFMVYLELYNEKNETIASSRRPGLVRHKTPLFRMLDTVVNVVPLVLGATWEAQSVMVLLLEKYEELESNPIHHAIVRLSDQRIQLYETNLHIDAYFQGLRYFMYHWKFTTGALFISIFLFWEAYIAYMSWKFAVAFFKKPEVKQNETADGKIILNPIEADGDLVGEVPPQEAEQEEEPKPEKTKTEREEVEEANAQAEEDFFRGAKEKYGYGRVAGGSSSQQPDHPYRPQSPNSSSSVPSYRPGSPPPYPPPGRHNSPPPMGSPYVVTPVGNYNYAMPSFKGTSLAGAAASGLSYANYVSSNLIRRGEGSGDTGGPSGSYYDGRASAYGRRAAGASSTVPVRAIEEPVTEGSQIRRTTSVMKDSYGTGVGGSTIFGMGGSRRDSYPPGMRYRRRGDGRVEYVLPDDMLGDLNGRGSSAASSVVGTDDVLRMGDSLDQHVPNEELDHEEMDGGIDHALDDVHEEVEEESAQAPPGGRTPQSDWSDVAEETVAESRQ